MEPLQNERLTSVFASRLSCFIIHCLLVSIWKFTRIEIFLLIFSLFIRTARDRPVPRILNMLVFIKKLFLLANENYVALHKLSILSLWIQRKRYNASEIHSQLLYEHALESDSYIWHPHTLSYIFKVQYTKCKNRTLLRCLSDCSSIRPSATGLIDHGNLKIINQIGISVAVITTNTEK